MSQIKLYIQNDWKKLLKREFKSPYFSKLKKFLIEEKIKYTIFPPPSLIFNAFNKTPFRNVKVVVLGQDPYHKKGQAHGLCFSVPAGIKPPPSLLNIFKELHADLNIPIPEHGNLTAWADQGVFLLNAILTVRASEAGSHQKRGWETFTDAVIKLISDNKKEIVFILWGRYAQNKAKIIDSGKHYILKAAHPSPLSAYNGFLGCKHFSKTNKFLKKNKQRIINWAL